MVEPGSSRSASRASAELEITRRREQRLWLNSGGAYGSP